MAETEGLAGGYVLSLWPHAGLATLNEKVITGATGLDQPPALPVVLQEVQ